MSDGAEGIIEAYAAGAAGLQEQVVAIGPDDWDRPGLGVWTVRDLTGHASRSLTTVRSYLTDPGEGPDGNRLDGSGRQLLGIRSALVIAEAVAQRGRDAGAALGDDPAGAVAALAAEVVALVRAAPAGSLAVTPFGAITLLDYLPTRTSELAVHTLDLARAVGGQPPASLGPAVTAACDLAGQVAGRLPDAADLLLSITGRGRPGGPSII